MTLSKVSQILVNLAATVIIARYLGVNLFGKYVIVFMIANAPEAILTGGFCTVVTREVARDKEHAKDYYYSAFVIQLLISGAIFLCAPLAVWAVYRNPLLVLASLLMGGSVFFRSIHALNLSLFRAFEKMDYDFKLTALGRALFLAMLLSVVSFDLRINGIFGAILAAQIVQTCSGIYLAARRILSLYPSRVSLAAGLVLREGWVISSNAFLTNLTFKVHPFILKAFGGDFAVGVFSVIARLFEQGKLVPRILLVSTFPHLSRLGESDAARLNKYLFTGLKAIFLIGAFASTAVFFGAERIVSLMYGDEYSYSAKVLKICSLLILMIPANMLFHYIFVASNRQNIATILRFAGVMIQIALGVLFIPTHGYIGAGWAFTGGETALFLLNCIAFLRRTSADEKRGPERSEIPEEADAVAI